MKVIDLLNKIAKGEEVPKEIRYKEKKWVYSTNVQDYIYENDREIKYLIQEILKGYTATKKLLLYKVEIIEEEKDIEEIEVENGHIVDYDETGKHYITTNRKDRNIYINKINELVREIRKLKDKE